MSTSSPVPTVRCTNACEACRRRKVKCSGGQPCRSCIRHGFECNFGVAGRQGYSEGYVQGLLATIKRRENEIESLKSSGFIESARKHLEAGDSLPSGTETDFSLSTGNVPEADQFKSQLGPRQSPVKSATELAPGPAFESRARSLLNDHVEGNRTYSSPHESLPIAESPYEPTSPWRPTTDLIDGIEPPPLPSEFQSNRLLGFFLPLMGVNQHFFDPRLFLDSMALLYQNERTRREQMRSLWYTEYLLVMAMGKLIGCLALKPKTPPGNIYFAEALRRLPPLHQLGSHGIIAVEMLCLVALYLQWCDRKHDAYLYIGNAVRLAVAQGCALPHEEQSGLPSEICHKVRVWWTAYMLDRRLSAGLGLPMAIDDRQIRAELPRPYAGFQSPLPLNINIRIARVTGEIMTSFYGTTTITQKELVQGIQKTLHALHELGRSIPTTFAVNFSDREVSVSRTSGSLYLMMFQAIILCIRPIILQSAKRKVMSDKENQNSDDMSPIIAKLCASCQDASTKSIKILSSLQRQKKIPFFGYFDLDAAFSAAFILILMQFIAANDPGKPPEELELAFEVLRYIASAGNRVAEQRLEDLKQFCFLVWSPEVLTQWKWLGAEGEPRFTMVANTVPKIGPSPSSVYDATCEPDMMWQGFLDEWPADTTALASGNELGDSLFTFEFGEAFEVDLSREAQGIYASFNDPALPVTGVDQVDWVEMEKMFRT